MQGLYWPRLYQSSQTGSKCVTETYLSLHRRAFISFRFVLLGYILIPILELPLAERCIHQVHLQYLATVFIATDQNELYVLPFNLQPIWQFS